MPLLIIKDRRQDAGAQPGGETQVGTSGDPEHKSPCPEELGCVSFWHGDVFADPEAL